MINILIVDDNESKRNRIVNTILENHNINEELIHIATCKKDAVSKMYDNNYDLVILDLVIPIERNGESKAKNGLKILDETTCNPFIKVPIHIVGMSGFKDELNLAKNDFSDRLWNLIEYDESSSEWEDKLSSIIYHLVKVRKRFIEKSIDQQYEILNKYFEENDYPNTSLGINWTNICLKISEIIERSLLVPSKFSNGSKAKNINKQSIIIQSEYDFQNLIHIVLRPWMPSTEAENIAIVFDGNSKNADFSIMGNSIIIEAKYIDSTGKKNDTLKTLEGLKQFYKQNGNVKSLLFLILVEKSVSIDKHKIENEFTQINSEPSILVKIYENNLST